MGEAWSLRTLGHHLTPSLGDLSIELCRWRVGSIVLARLANRAGGGLLFASESGGLLIELGGTTLELLGERTKL
jgi:hypothetical protein